MALEWEQVIVDAADPEALGRWWAEALEWVVVNDDPEEFEIRPTPDEVPGLLFARVAEPKTLKNRLHLDFRPDDQDAAVARFVDLGATRADVGQGRPSWVVLRDPEGKGLPRAVRAEASSPMRLVIARCSVDYEGRLTAHLPMATRLLMVKADGCVSIHADGGAYKPLNWMSPPCRLSEEEGRWVVSSPKGETLTITLEEVLSDVEHDLGIDPGLQKDGVEAHLQELLAADPTRIQTGLVLVRREHATDIGPVDPPLPRRCLGVAVAIEVKRRGEIDGVEQLARYLERMELDPHTRGVRGVFVAQVVKPQARVLAAARGIEWVEVDYDDLRGVERAQSRLF